MTDGERQGLIVSNPEKRGGWENTAWSLCLVILPAPVKRSRISSPKGEVGTQKRDRVPQRRGGMLSSQKQ